MECLQLLLIFAVTGYCVSAPFFVDPGNWNSRARVYPAVIGGHGVLGRPHFRYPPIQAHYPTIEYDYTEYQGRKYPHAPNFPISPKNNNYPQFSNNLPPTTLEQDDMNRGFDHPKTTLEQDDMNRGIEESELPRDPTYASSEENIFNSDSDEDYSDNVIPNAN